MFWESSKIYILSYSFDHLKFESETFNIEWNKSEDNDFQEASLCINSIWKCFKQYPLGKILAIYWFSYQPVSLQVCLWEHHGSFTFLAEVLHFSNVSQVTALQSSWSTCWYLVNNVLLPKDLRNIIISKVLFSRAFPSLSSCCHLLPLIKIGQIKIVTLSNVRRSTLFPTFI